MNFKFFILAFAAVTVMFGSARAQWFSWEARTGVSIDGMNELGSEMSKRGFAPIRMDAASNGSGPLEFSSVWVLDNELAGTRWELRANMGKAMWAAELESLKQRGFAPIDLTVNRVENELVYGGIWAKGSITSWQAWTDLTKEAVAARDREFAVNGLQIIDINAYEAEGSLKYAVVWGDSGSDGQINAVGLSETEFQQRMRNLPAGYVARDLDVFNAGGRLSISAVFVKEPDYESDLRYNLSDAEYQEYFNERANAGYSPHGISSYVKDGRRNYAALFFKKRPEQRRSSPVYAVPETALPAIVARTLPIAPVHQQTKVWCWLAVGEMIFRHFGVENANPAGNFQCGIIGTIMSDTECSSNCFNARCIRPSGSNLATVRMLKDYAWMSSRRVLRADEGYELPFAAIKQNIDSGKPVIAGVSPIRRNYYDGAEHVALIVGYAANARGIDVIVNDPFPYPVMGNPYTRAGATRLTEYSYKMPLRDFTQGMFWHWSISNISVR